MSQRRSGKTISGLSGGSGAHNHQIGDFIPAFNDSYDIGTNLQRWRRIYTNGVTVSNSLNVGGLSELQAVDVHGNLQVLGLNGSPGNVSVTGTLTVDESLTVMEAVYLQQNLLVEGNAIVNGHLSVNEGMDIGGPMNMYDNLQVQGDLDVVGRNGQPGNVLATGNATVNGDIIAGGNVNVDENLNVYGTAQIFGSTTAHSDLTVGQSLNVSEAATVVGSTNLEGTLDVWGFAQFASNAAVDGNLQVGGTLTVTGTSQLTGNATANANLTVGQNLTVSGPATLQGTLQVVGNSTLQGTLSVTGNATASANLTVGQNLTVTGPSSLASTLQVGGNSTLQGTLTVTGTSQLTGNATASSNLTVGQNLTVTGATSLASTLQVGGNTTLQGTLAVTGTSQLTGNTTASSNLTVGQNLTVTGPSSLASTLQVGGNTTLQGTLAVTGTSQLTGNATAAANLAVGQTLTVTGATSLQSTLQVGGNTTLQGTLAVTGTSQLTGNTTASSNLTVGQNLNVSGPSSLQSTLQVGGNTTLQGTLAVTGTSQLTGNATVKGNLNVDAGKIATVGSASDNLIENSGGPDNQSSSTIITPRLHGVGAVTTPFLNVMGYALADQFAATRQTDTTSRLDTNAAVRFEGGLAVSKTVWANIVRADQLINTLDLACSRNLTVAGRLGVGAAGSVSPARPLVVNDALGDTHISEMVNTSASGSGSTTYKNNTSKVLDVGVAGSTHPTVALRDRPYLNAAESIYVPNGMMVDNMVTARTMVSNGGSSTPGAPVTVLKLHRAGVFNQSNNNEVDFQISRFESSLYTSKTQLNINLWDVQNTPTIMTLRSNGCVGINTATPTTALDVAGTVKTTDLQVANPVTFTRLNVNAPSSANATEFAARFARSNTTNGRLTMVGMGTEGNVFTKSGFGFLRTDSYDRGEFCIYNGNTADGSDVNPNFHRRMRISPTGYCLFSSLPDGGIVPSANVPFQIYTSFQGGDVPYLLTNENTSAGTTGQLKLGHGSHTLSVGPNANLNGSFVRGSGETTIATDSGSINLKPGTNGNVLCEAPQRVILKSPTEISLEADQHVFRNASAVPGVNFKNNSIGFNGSSFRFGVGPNGNLAIMNADFTFNRYI